MLAGILPRYCRNENAKRVSIDEPCDGQLNGKYIIPVKISDIDKFERQKMIINVFGIKGKSPLRITKKLKTHTSTYYYYYFDRMRDHCHLTEQFRGAAHSDCNLN